MIVTSVAFYSSCRGSGDVETTPLSQTTKRTSGSSDQVDPNHSAFNTNGNNSGSLDANGGNSSDHNDLHNGNGDNCVVIKHTDNEWGVSTLFQERNLVSYYVFMPAAPEMKAWKTMPPSEDQIRKAMRSNGKTAAIALRGAKWSSADTVTGNQVCTYSGSPKGGRNRNKECIDENVITATRSFEGKNYRLLADGQVGTDDCPSYSVTDDGWNGSPLILDFAGKGLEVSSVDDGVYFDLIGNGTELVSWPTNTADTAWLVLDTNLNGQIDSISELFGNNTPDPKGVGFKNGFDALAAYDLNGDGKIDSQDPIYDQLQLWFDTDRDGDSATHELVTLSGRVDSISLGYIDRIENDDSFGNETRQRSTFAAKDGSTQVIYDLWLVRDNKHHSLGSWSSR